MARKQETSPTSVSGRLFAGIEDLILRYRLAAHVVVHSILFFLALMLAYLVRFDAAGGIDKTWFFDRFLPWLPYFVIVKLLIFGRMKLFRGGWLYASIRDVANIVIASWLFVALTFLLVVLFRHVPIYMDRQVPLVFEKYSNGVLVLDFLATVFLVCTVRLGFRIYREELRPISPEGVRNVLIVGAGNAAETIVREIQRMQVQRYRVVGLVDDDQNKRHFIIHGASVLGRTEDIRQICEDHDVEEIIVAVPSATQKELQRIIQLCSGTKLSFQSLPSVGDLIDGRVTVSQIRPVDINDLLGREAVELDREALAKFLKDRRVLITGAGGSIGSEMCRQVVNYRPAQLILVEQAENPLFEINNELRSSHPDIPVTAIVCDIFDRQRVMQVWGQCHPDVVIHAAAHKHVPLMENNPSEAIKNNILGTRNVADASCRHDVAEFVMISTDKAVNPSSVMGASKRVAEIYTQALNGQPDCKTQFKAVRFGNVLGSAGSVVPTFRKQIAEGGPVRVTHPEMTRYFMTIPEASQLVLEAAATGTGGQIYLLDMGEPVKIVDLARQMITLSGFRPGEDIDITFTGVRPGEKLFEELRTVGEDIEPTVHAKVLIWMSKKADLATVGRHIDELADLAESSDWVRITQALRKIVPEYNPLNPPEGTKLGKRADAPVSGAVQP